MIEPKENNHVTLTLYPNNVGVAYVVSQGVDDILDEGIKKVSAISVDGFVKRSSWLFDYAKPELVIVRDPEGAGSKISNTTQKAIASIVSLAKSKGLPVYQYSREQIRETFKSLFEVSTKFGIARKICLHYKHLKPIMPHYRSITKNEHYQMGVFDAYSLMVTHYYLTA